MSALAQDTGVKTGIEKSARDRARYGAPSFTLPPRLP
jgi:hypothetical protein